MVDLFYVSDINLLSASYLAVFYTRIIPYYIIAIQIIFASDTE